MEGDIDGVIERGASLPRHPPFPPTSENAPMARKSRSKTSQPAPTGVAGTLDDHANLAIIKLAQKEERGMETYELQPGFYIVDGAGVLRCKRVKTKEHGEVEVPIRCRTIKAAQDVLAAITESCAILAVADNGFGWSNAQN